MEKKAVECRLEVLLDLELHVLIRAIITELRAYTKSGTNPVQNDIYSADIKW